MSTEISAEQTTVLNPMKYKSESTQNRFLLRLRDLIDERLPRLYSCIYLARLVTSEDFIEKVCYFLLAEKVILLKHRSI